MFLASMQFLSAVHREGFETAGISSLWALKNKSSKEACVCEGVC